MTKQTIALIGSDRSLGSALARKIAAGTQYRLLLIMEQEKQPNRFGDQTPGSDTEFIDCLKDGCWEADIIMVDKPESAAADVTAKMREVATQKIVFLITEEEDMPVAFLRGRDWQSLLPNAKLVAGFSGNSGREIFLSGADQDAVQNMADLMNDLGYQSIISHKN